MAEDDAGLRDRNVAIATELMERFGHDMDGWYDHLHDDIVMEFPFGACVGMPTRIEGRAPCAAVSQNVCDAVQVRFSIIGITPMSDPTLTAPNRKTVVLGRDVSVREIPVGRRFIK